MKGFYFLIFFIVAVTVWNSYQYWRIANALDRIAGEMRDYNNFITD